MSELRLQDYVTKIKDLIQKDRPDEAIAHGQHILRHHSKHIATYCLLGEACLEKGAVHEAVEFFQRTLSADPENFIGRVGLGIIYGGQGALPEAIWQMERAFELAPGNAEVRRQLQQLYCQRDGEEKTRLVLTQGALGRLYSRNGLYERAINEFRAILDQDPDLPHIQIALGEALWQAGRRVEAVETCSDLLDALPNCLKANLILGEVWTKGGPEAAGRERLQVAQALDPENLVAQEMMGHESPLPPQEVLIPQLEVVPGTLAPSGAEEGVIPAEDLVPGGEAVLVVPRGQVVSERRLPDWLQDLEDEGPSAAAKPETALSEEAGVLAGEEEVVESTEEEEPDQRLDLKAPADVFEEGALVPPEEEVLHSMRAPLEAGILDEEEDLAAQGAEEVPQWLRDLIGEEVPAAETPQAWEEEEPIVPPAEEAALVAEAAAEEEGVKAVPEEAEAEEMPEWLRDLGVAAAETASVDETTAGVREEVTVPEEAEAEEEVPPEEMPEWLRDLDVPGAEGMPPPLEESTPHVEPVVEEGVVEKVPGWLKALWLQAAATMPSEEEVPPEGEAVSPEAEAGELPKWVKALGALAATRAAAEKWAAEEEAPEGEEPSMPPSAVEEGAMLPPQEGVPENLQALVTAGILDESDVASAMAEVSAEELAAQQTEAVPEWLRDLIGEEALGAKVAPVPAGEEEAVKPPQAQVPEEVSEGPEEKAPIPSEEGPTEAEVPLPVAEEDVAEEVEEAPALEEMALEPPTAESVEEAHISGQEEERAEVGVEAAPSAEMEMVAPYDRVEVEEDVPARRRIDDLVQRLEANPHDDPLRLELARLYREERDWNAALTHYQKLISTRKFLPTILDDLDLMLRRQVEPARVYQLMGDAYLQESALDKALQMYRLAQQALIKR
jgi:tetratricopeptide (TPR) repeat protein